LITAALALASTARRRARVVAPARRARVAVGGRLASARAFAFVPRARAPRAPSVAAIARRAIARVPRASSARVTRAVDDGRRIVAVARHTRRAISARGRRFWREMGLNPR